MFSRLNEIDHNGILLEVQPSSLDTPRLSTITNTLHSFWYHDLPTSFEVWSHNRQIRLLFWTRNSVHAERIQQQFHALYPHARFHQSQTNFAPYRIGDYVCSATIELQGVKFARIRSIISFLYDPLSHLIEAMLPYTAWLQILFKPATSLTTSMNEIRRDDSEIMGITDKLQQPCFHGIIRIATFSEHAQHARDALTLIAQVFAIFSGQYAELRPRLVSYPIFHTAIDDMKDMIQRHYPSFWNLLLKPQRILFAIDELAVLVHLPVDIPVMNYYCGVELPPPPTHATQRTGPLLGTLMFRDTNIGSVRLDVNDLFTHQYVIGGSGTGKSTLLINEVKQVLKLGLCCWVVDPHGDLAYDMVEHVEADKIVFLDPLRVGFTLNPFELPSYHDQYERAMMIERIIGQMVEMMKRLFGYKYWGPALNRTFQNVIRILYQRDDCPTFEDILNILHHRYDRLGNFANHAVFHEFREELARIPRERMDAVINKVDPFVKNTLLRRIFCNKISNVNIDTLTQPGTLVIWRLAKAELTEVTMGMIGSAIITKLWFTSAARKQIERSPIFLVIDEFQNFAYLETLNTLLAEARKYRIGLALTHQQTKQLPERLLGEILSNAATKIIFRVSGNDAALLARNIDNTYNQHLTSLLPNLPDGAAIVKLKASFGHDPIPPFKISTLPPPPKQRPNFPALLARMQQEYASPVPPIHPSSHTLRFTPKILDLLTITDKIVQEQGEPSQSTLFQRLSVRKIIGKASDLTVLVDHAESLGLIERVILKEGKGRPKILVRLTNKGLTAIGKKVTAGSSQKGGGDLHRAMMMQCIAYFRAKGYYVKIPVQAGRALQPDLLVYPRKGNRWGQPIALEIETRGQHPQQVVKNYTKNINAGYRVAFVVTNKTIAQRLRAILGERKTEIYVLSELYSIKQDINAFPRINGSADAL
jgi:hypothetical protein